MRNEIKFQVEEIKTAELKYLSDKSKQNKQQLEFYIDELLRDIDVNNAEENTYILSNILPITSKLSSFGLGLSNQLLESPRMKVSKSIWSILINKNLIKKSNTKRVDYEISPYNKKLEKIFKNIVLDDDLKISLTGINYEDGTATGTNANNLLHIVTKNKNEPSYNGNYYLYSDIEQKYLKDKKKYKDVPNSINEYYELTGNIGQKFPDWKRVIPNGYHFYKEFDLDYLNGIVLTIYENNLTNPITNIVAFEFDTEDGKFHIGLSAELLSQLCESLIMAGENLVKFYFSSRFFYG